jgi:hypothetical protein
MTAKLCKDIRWVLETLLSAHRGEMEDIDLEVAQTFMTHLVKKYEVEHINQTDYPGRTESTRDSKLLWEIGELVGELRKDRGGSDG